MKALCKYFEAKVIMKTILYLYLHFFSLFIRHKNSFLSTCRLKVESKKLETPAQVTMTYLFH